MVFRTLNWFLFGRYAPVLRLLIGAPLGLFGLLAVDIAATEWWGSGQRWDLAEDLRVSASTTEGMVVGAHPAFTRGEMVVSVSYRVGGHEYAGTQQIVDSQWMGQSQVTLTYDPADPARFMFAGQQVRRTFPTHWLLGGLLAFLLGTLFVVDAIQRLRTLLDGEDA